MAALWIGGPPGAGKTTVARLLARRHGLRLYSTDTRTWEHRDRALAAGLPAAVRWEALSPAQRWSAPPAELLAMALHRERADMIADDVRALPPSPLTVVEGTPVTATTTDGPAVWLLPSAQVQEARLAGRGLNPGVRTLYRLLADEIGRDARGRDVVTVDGLGVDAVLAAVEQVFAPALRAGPTAATPSERRELLREANEAIAGQYRAFASRPWAPPGALTTVVAFACECGRASCTADVELPVGARRRAVRAPGHGP